jgi:hypothetical protein
MYGTFLNDFSIGFYSGLFAVEGLTRNTGTVRKYSRRHIRLAIAIKFVCFAHKLVQYLFMMHSVVTLHTDAQLN